MAAQLTPEEFADLNALTIGIPTRSELVAQQLARAKALRGAEVPQPASVGAQGGLLAGLARGINGFAGGLKENQQYKNLQKIADERAQTSADLFKRLHAAPPGPQPSTPDEAALMQPPQPGGDAMYGGGAMPGVPGAAEADELGPLAGIQGSGMNAQGLPVMPPAPFMLG